MSIGLWLLLSLVNAPGSESIDAVEPSRRGTVFDATLSEREPMEQDETGDLGHTGNSEQSGGKDHPGHAAAMGPASEKAPRIDLITVGFGAALYATFGHAAIRVIEPDGTDRAFNFGGVDMNQPHFWTRVLQGRMETYLEVTPYSELLLRYSAEDRTIEGRTLAFTVAQARELLRRLEAISKSSERVYVYHHVLDNCTTRPMHLFDDVLGGALARASAFPVAGTYRDWILDRVRMKPWLYLAMDLAGNGMGDVSIRAWDTIFLPEAVEQIVDRFQIDGQPFVLGRYTDYVSQSFSRNENWDWPWTKVYILFGAPLFLLALWRLRPALLVRGLVFGAVGVTYVVFWAASDYEFYHRNWNMLLFPPTDLGLFVLSLSGRAWHRFATARAIYLRAHLGVLALLALLVAFGVLQQAITPMLALAFPLSLAAVCRDAVRATFLAPAPVPDPTLKTRGASSQCPSE